MSVRPRIVYITPNAVLNPNRGGRIRAHHLWRAMSAYADVVPIVVGDTDSPSTRSRMRIAGARLFPRRRYRPGPDAPPGLFEVLGQADPPAEWLDQLGEPDALARHCLNAGRVERILRTLAHLRPQLVVLCDTSLGLLAPYIRALGAPIVVAPHNHDSALYESMAQRTGHVWSRLAAQAFHAAEEIFAPCVDQLWVCSQEDAHRFGQRLVDPQKIRVLPNVYDVGAPSPLDRESRDLVFVGQAHYYPNEVAIRNLFQISAALDARGVAHRLRIVGRVGDDVKSAARACPSVEMVGYVASVAPYVEAAALAPIALTMGGGTRVKILEALSLARPVLSTPIGIEGIACENGVNAVVEPDLQAFPDRIEELLGDRARAKRLALAGWELARRNYSPEALVGYVGAALRALGLTKARPSAASLGRNLGACVESESAVFNPITRLLVWRAVLRVAAPVEALLGELTCESAPDLANAFVEVRPAGMGRVWLNGAAILRASVAPSALKMGLRAWGVLVFSWAPPREIAAETAGMLALEPSTDGGMELTAWGLASAVAFSPPAPAAQRPGPIADVAIATGRFEREVAKVEVATAAGPGPSFANAAAWLAAAPTSRRLSEWKDKHVGEVAWIIGNGPSVATADLDRLAGRLVLCFNRFHLAHEATKLRATYTFSGDAQMIEDFGQRIVDESGGVVFLAHPSAPDLVGDYVWLRQAQVFPPLFSKRPDRVVSPGGSTPYVAMQVAYYMGVRKFYFYGADFTFRFTGAKPGGDSFRRATGEGNHFIANYRSGRPWCPPSLLDIGASFLTARLVMEAEGGFIRNVTRGGALEIFPREDFESVLAAG